MFFFCVSEILARERGMPPPHKIIYVYVSHEIHIDTKHTSWRNLVDSPPPN